MSTREFYEAGYAVGDPRMGHWRAIGARSKAAHVETLTRRAGLTPRTVVEIGCGDGAVLAELAQRGWTLDGFELAENAARRARERGVARRVERFDGEHVPASSDEYDLAVLSHVLEHVPDPLPLLKEAARVGRWVLVEVPLEDNRSAKRPAKKRLSEDAGHLHAFNRADVLRLVCEAGLEPRGELTDPLPYEHHAFFSGAAKGAVKWAARSALHRVGVAERLITLHYAVLATRA
ncbi:MAG TPA: class I SAM-dependent methyltransferase [Solirubrobacteraceae bacterium]|nr:class I SAM-dependent methyltransferase [Solirubrobacteraceae bacterium]